MRTMDVTYNPLSAEWRADPYSKYRELRREAPVFFSEGANAYCVSRYADVFLEEGWDAAREKQAALGPR